MQCAVKNYLEMLRHLLEHLVRKNIKAPIISQLIVSLHIPNPETTILLQKGIRKQKQNQGKGIKDATLFAGNGTFAAIWSPAPLLPLMETLA
jgi:hypothetical protein